MAVKPLLALVFLFLAQTQAQTYWFDSSCNTKVNGVADEFKEMAARASFRVANSQDSNQLSVFQRLFKNPSSHQPTYTEVQRELIPFVLLSITSKRLPIGHFQALSWGVMFD